MNKKLIINLWSFLSGKKTYLGTVSTFFIIYLFQEGCIDNATFTLLGSISGATFGIGIGHKIHKKNKKNGT